MTQTTPLATPSAAAAGTLSIGADLRVHRLGVWRDAAHRAGGFGARRPIARRRFGSCAVRSNSG